LEEEDPLLGVEGEELGIPAEAEPLNPLLVSKSHELSSCLESRIGLSLGGEVDNTEEERAGEMIEIGLVTLFGEPGDVVVEDVEDDDELEDPDEFELTTVANSSLILEVELVNFSLDKSFEMARSNFFLCPNFLIPSWSMSTSDNVATTSKSSKPSRENKSTYSDNFSCSNHSDTSWLIFL